jgi:hypothetical protein
MKPVILIVIAIYIIFCIGLNFVDLSIDWKAKVKDFIYYSWFSGLSNAIMHKYLIHTFFILQIIAHTVLVKFGFDAPNKAIFITGIPSVIWAIIQKVKFLCWLLVRDRSIGFWSNVWQILSKN